MAKKKSIAMGEGIDVSEVMRTPEMVDAVTEEIDKEIVADLKVAALGKPLIVDKRKLGVFKAVHCKMAGWGIVPISACATCKSFGGYIYRQNGEDVICWEESKEKAWERLKKTTKKHKK